MSKKILTKKQREELSSNKNIVRCGGKTITYTKEFKIKAVKQYYDEYMTPNEIFRQAGFNMDLIGEDRPECCLRRWKNTFSKKGVGALEEQRGKNRIGKFKKFKDKTDKEKIERLEATVAYLKAENDFLVKLRAKRSY